MRNLVAFVGFQVVFLGLVLFVGVQYYLFFFEYFNEDLFLSLFSTVVATQFSFLFFFAIVHKITRILMRNEEGVFKAGSWDFNLWGIEMTVLDCAYFLVNKLFIHQFFPAVFYKLFGAKIGKRTGIYAKMWDVELMEIGDDTFLGTDCIIGPHAISQGELYRKRIKIGNNCTIGAGTIILPGVTIENNVIVASNSVIPANRTLEANSIFGGTPVKRIREWNGESVWKTE